MNRIEGHEPSEFEEVDPFHHPLFPPQSQPEATPAPRARTVTPAAKAKAAPAESTPAGPESASVVKPAAKPAAKAKAKPAAASAAKPKCYRTGPRAARGEQPELAGGRVACAANRDRAGRRRGDRRSARVRSGARRDRRGHPHPCLLPVDRAPRPRGQRHRLLADRGTRAAARHQGKGLTAAGPPAVRHIMGR